MDCEVCLILSLYTCIMVWFKICSVILLISHGIVFFCRCRRGKRGSVASISIGFKHYIHGHGKRVSKVFLATFRPCFVDCA